MSKSRRIFKRLFWWLSKSKSRGSSSPKERTSSQETTTGEKEEEKLVIKTNPPVEQPQLKEEKPVININPPIVGVPFLYACLNAVNTLIFCLKFNLLSKGININPSITDTKKPIINPNILLARINIYIHPLFIIIL